MTVTTNDIAALAYLGRRIREEKPGVTKWDEPGIAAGVRRMVDRGFGFDEILDQVVNHARDRSAVNPGVLGHPVSAQPAQQSTPRNPTRGNQCDTCGLRNSQCVCTPGRRKPVVDSQAPGVQKAIGKVRETLAAARSMP